MGKVLVTCFEPFGGSDVNSSMQAVEELKKDLPEDWHTMVLPVVFGEAADLAVKRTRELRPDAVILTGQAEGRRRISVEALGRNIRNARIPDNAGQQPENEKIVRGGEELFAPDCDMERLTQMLAERGIHASLSTDAGSFVCNDVYYSMLRAFRGSGIRVIFMHFPLSTAEGMSPVLFARAVRTAAEILTKEDYI